MRAYSRQLLIILFLLLSTGCAQTPNELPPTQEYGDLLFTMGCQWQPRNQDSSLWQCQADVDNHFVTGFIVLELMNDERLAFCGENLQTNTGNDMYDTLVASYTEDRFNCIFVSERVSGNEFDWLWYNGENRLVMIWRPQVASHKYVTLIIDDGDEEKNAEGRVYYREQEQ